MRYPGNFTSIYEDHIGLEGFLAGNLTEGRILQEKLMPELEIYDATATMDEMTPTRPTNSTKEEQSWTMVGQSTMATIIECQRAPGWWKWAGGVIGAVGFTGVFVSCMAIVLTRRAQKMKTIVNSALVWQAFVAALSLAVSSTLDTILMSFDCTFFSNAVRLSLCRASFIVYLFSMCHYFYASVIVAMYRVVCTSWSSVLLGVSDDVQKIMAIVPSVVCAVLTSTCALYKAYTKHPFILNCAYGSEPPVKAPPFFKLCLIVIPVASEAGTLLLYAYIVYVSSNEKPKNGLDAKGNHKRRRNFNLVTARAGLIQSLIMAVFCVHPAVVSAMQTHMVRVDVSVVIIRISTHVTQGIIGPVLMFFLSSELRKCASELFPFRGFSQEGAKSLFSKELYSRFFHRYRDGVINQVSPVTSGQDF